MRSTDEWQGKDADAVPPPRVRLRVFDSAAGRCHLCERKIPAGEYWQCDHVLALVNGGSNHESNLRPACRNCCYRKTAQDVAEKAQINRIRSKHLGIARRSGSPIPGSKASGWKKKMNGEVVRR